ncbi:carbohydrate ABC transporter permease [Paenibacillus sp. J5C_2022]|uniref:carbohydrate ABC transporter permease n=1 Tax=Paenibacillus sp. J5C2022 TaxID=2977129 RepID=UPI0021D352FE|nr:carbohydrate ABC transporter permease [Paenibacillus sp. J5C2022]MCU6709930.1 carbohydrate ABC transporter permease [Paenibacillus sp. J5C2022]
MRKKTTTFDYVNHALLIGIALMMIIPFYSVIIQSFATPKVVASQPIYLVPSTLDFSAYKQIFEGKQVWDSIGISIFVTLFGTFVNMVATMGGAYALTKKHLPGKGLIVALVVFSMLFHGGLIPTYLTVKSLGLINDVFSMILPVAINTYYMIIMMSFFRTIPDSLEEAAKIDGANDMRILVQIVLPISMPMIAAIALFYAVDRWNEWWNAMLYIRDSSKYPLQLYVRELLTDIGRITNSDMALSDITEKRNLYPQGVKMAIVTVTTLPIIFVYPWLQKYFGSGVMIGSLKE